MNHIFDGISTKLSLYQRSTRFSFVFSRTFIVLHFTLRSMSHFELIFVNVKFIFLFLYMWISRGCLRSIVLLLLPLLCFCFSHFSHCSSVLETFLVISLISDILKCFQSPSEFIKNILHTC